MDNMKYILASLIIGTGVWILGSQVLAHGNDDKVTICHRTNSVTNPYVKVEVDKSAIDGEGNNDHSHHTGPVATNESIAQGLKDSDQKWGDIIPEVLNWTAEGQTMWQRDCEYVKPDTNTNVNQNTNENTNVNQNTNQFTDVNQNVPVNNTNTSTNVNTPTPPVVSPVVPDAPAAAVVVPQETVAVAEPQRPGRVASGDTGGGELPDTGSFPWQISFGTSLLGLGYILKRLGVRK